MTQAMEAMKMRWGMLRGSGPRAMNLVMGAMISWYLLVLIFWDFCVISELVQDSEAESGRNMDTKTEVQEETTTAAHSSQAVKKRIQVS